MMNGLELIIYHLSGRGKKIQKGVDETHYWKVHTDLFHLFSKYVDNFIVYQNIDLVSCLLETDHQNLRMG